MVYGGVTRRSIIRAFVFPNDTISCISDRLQKIDLDKYNYGHIMFYAIEECMSKASKDPRGLQSYVYVSGKTLPRSSFAFSNHGSGKTNLSEQGGYVYK